MKLYLNPQQLIQILLVCLLANPLLAQSLKKVKLNRLDRIVEMTKSPCQGNCPAYTLIVYEKGIVSFDGRRNAPRLGLYVKKLDAKTYQKLIATFKKANLWQYDDTYRGSYSEAQTVAMSYHEEGDVKTIEGKDSRPYVLLELEGMLDQIAAGSGWELRSAAPGGSELPDNVIADELIVQLQTGTAATAWVRKYRREEVEVVQHISKDNNYWLVRYNAKMVAPTEMLSKVREDTDVVGAEFNKRVELR
jgi:hypothetical protein